MLIKMYQMIFSGKIPRCRYLPSCSNYAIEAIGRLGIITGGLISLKRILRCHPWGGHGFDPVPYKKI